MVDAIVVIDRNSTAVSMLRPDGQGKAWLTDDKRTVDSIDKIEVDGNDPSDLGKLALLERFAQLTQVATSSIKYAGTLRSFANPVTYLLNNNGAEVLTYEGFHAPDEYRASSLRSEVFTCEKFARTSNGNLDKCSVLSFDVFAGGSVSVYLYRDSGLVGAEELFKPFDLYIEKVKAYGGDVPISIK